MVKRHRNIFFFIIDQVTYNVVKEEQDSASKLSKRQIFLKLVRTIREAGSRKVELVQSGRKILWLNGDLKFFKVSIIETQKVKIKDTVREQDCCMCAQSRRRKNSIIKPEISQTVVCLIVGKSLVVKDGTSKCSCL